MDRQRPNDGSKMAIGSFKSHGGAKTRRAAVAEAEARGAASAQAPFPARRARERMGVQKSSVAGEVKPTATGRGNAVPGRQGWLEARREQTGAVLN